MADDLDTIIALTRRQRQQLAAWSPVYFNPREGADDGHAAFLTFLVASDDHETIVVEGTDGVVAFVVRIFQENHLWIDDLCVDDPARWPQVVEALALDGRRWVTCVAAADVDRLSALTRSGATCLSRYWVRSISDIAAGPLVSPAPVDADPSLAAPHTFGGGKAFAAEAPGSLVVTDNQGGHLVGSASVSPPIYDPGGPTCVIDQVVGENRGDLIERALAECARRGDSQVVVVAHEDDSALAAILKRCGFTAEVLIIGAQPEP